MHSPQHFNTHNFPPQKTFFAILASPLQIDCYWRFLSLIVWLCWLFDQIQPTFWGEDFLEENLPEIDGNYFCLKIPTSIALFSLHISWADFALHPIIGKHQTASMRKILLKVRVLWKQWVGGAGRGTEVDWMHLVYIVFVSHVALSLKSAALDCNYDCLAYDWLLIREKKKSWAGPDYK